MNMLSILEFGSLPRILPFWIVNVVVLSNLDYKM